MSFRYSIDYLETTLLYMGLIPIKFNKKNQKYEEIKILHWQILKVLFYIILTVMSIKLHPITTTTSSLVIELILRITFRIVWFTYDFVQILELNLFSRQFCTIMNKILNMSKLFENDLKFQRKCKQLRYSTIKLLFFFVVYTVVCITQIILSRQGVNLFIWITLIYHTFHIYTVYIQNMYISICMDFISYYLIALNTTNGIRTFRNIKEKIEWYNECREIVRKLNTMQGMQILCRLLLAVIIFASCFFIVYEFIFVHADRLSIGITLLIISSPLLVVIQMCFKFQNIHEKASSKNSLFSNLNINIFIRPDNPLK